MGNTYKINGTLALKPAHHEPKLSVINGTRNHGPSIFRNIFDHCFEYLFMPIDAADVQAALSGKTFDHIFDTAQERRFIRAAGAIALCALFFFSFFSF